MIHTAVVLLGMNEGVQGTSLLTEAGTWDFSFSSAQLYNIIVKQESKWNRVYFQTFPTDSQVFWGYIST